MVSGAGGGKGLLAESSCSLKLGKELICLGKEIRCWRLLLVVVLPIPQLLLSLVELCSERWFSALYSCSSSVAPSTTMSREPCQRSVCSFKFLSYCCLSAEEVIELGQWSWLEKQLPRGVAGQRLLPLVAPKCGRRSQPPSFLPSGVGSIAKTQLHYGGVVEPLPVPTDVWQWKSAFHTQLFLAVPNAEALVEPVCSQHGQSESHGVLETVVPLSATLL